MSLILTQLGNQYRTFPLLVIKQLVIFVLSKFHITFIYFTSTLLSVAVWLCQTLDPHLSKALFSLDPYNLQLLCFLGLGALFNPNTCKTLQTVQVAPCQIRPADTSSVIHLSQCPFHTAHNKRANSIKYTKITKLFRNSKQS